MYLFYQSDVIQTHKCIQRRDSDSLVPNATGTIITADENILKYETTSIENLNIYLGYCMLM